MSEHAHDYSYAEIGNPKLKSKTTRELTDTEKRENDDVLQDYKK